METDIPKQYLMLQDKTVLEHTLERLLAIENIVKIVVVVAPDDELWPSLEVSNEPRVSRADGGLERCHSVLNGLRAIDDQPESWVLVHDAARPCVRPADIVKMVETFSTHPVGGILAAPLRDTLKRSSSTNAITETVDRTSLWHAFTPQMFRLGTLREALSKAIANNLLVTDEAQAIENCGLIPMLFEGHADNLKITRPADLALASLYMDAQRAEA